MLCVLSIEFILMRKNAKAGNVTGARTGAHDIRIFCLVMIRTISKQILSLRSPAARGCQSKVIKNNEPYVVEPLSYEKCNMQLCKFDQSSAINKIPVNFNVC